jgi:predicted  nucleic acid-binding Zn-ribbon protein
MIEVYSTLLELQTIDKEIVQANTELEKYGPQIDVVENPIRTLQAEADAARTRLVDMRAQTAKLETAANNKRDRLKQYETRLERIRNAREEAAAKAEMDLVRRAIDADEQEALELMEQTRRTDMKLDDMEKQLIKLRGEIEPRKLELIESRQRAAADVQKLTERRKNHVLRMDQHAVRLYERVRGTKQRAALAPLKAGGACGNCFNIIPLQEQTQVRAAVALHRCEACGVILYPESD